MAVKKNYILDKSVAEKKLRRMALQIMENNAEEKQIILAGIKESGMVVAKCIRKILSEISSFKIELIEISLDKRRPKEVKLSKNIDFDDKLIIVIDDVANSGKTLLYALKPFLRFYPKKIQTLVLVERSHNDFPVRPDYVGLSVSTTPQEHIIVEVEKEKILGAYLK
ncbi:MAG TPA: phosphoribosyltransferase family protein [Chitinophagaceae bacterium]|nr:phosphoribosyltransferase family protein [Chitinophagaceae bacterium]